MIKIHLKAESNELKVKEYKIFYPESILINKKSQKNTFYSVCSLQCERIQGSFLLFYSRKINISKIKKNGDELDVVDGKLTNPINIQIDEDASAVQYLTFGKRLLLYVNEHDSNSYLNEKKSKLPAFLLKEVDDIKESVQFWVEYTDNSVLLKNEEIIIYLNLHHEQ